ncbi:hypothetical protein [Brevundimonas halotolerans]|uniref:hypothetical protein n=1 Tax=Brevundimonas halotolerans TaxID=69670 RepID=UPI0021A8F683|nr:hypothetical protein [Brevundimonas halotolerans]
MGSVDPAAAGGVDPYGGDAQQTLDWPAPHGHSLHIAVSTVQSRCTSTPRVTCTLPAASA